MGALPYRGEGLLPLLGRRVGGFLFLFEGKVWGLPRGWGWRNGGGSDAGSAIGWGGAMRQVRWKCGGGGGGLRRGAAAAVGEADGWGRAGSDAASAMGRGGGVG